MKPWAGSQGQSALLRQISQADENLPKVMECHYEDMTTSRPIVWEAAAKWIRSELSHNYVESGGSPETSHLRIPNLVFDLLHDLPWVKDRILRPSEHEKHTALADTVISSSQNTRAEVHDMALHSTGTPILERWTYRSPESTLRSIVPDGCQDLIHWSVPGEMPRWSLSRLQDGILTAGIPQGAELVGYRFAPGAELSGAELSAAALQSLLHDRSDDPDFTIARVADAVVCDPQVTDALSAVAALPLSVEATAGALGVSRRTLERLLLRHTGKPPVFWSQLARVRAAARAVVTGQSQAELAYQAGYSDQAHMSRAVRRWFGVSPTELLHRPDLTEQLYVPGYDAATGEQISTR